MVSMDPKEFPSIPASTPVAKKGGVVMSLAADVLAEMIEKTLFAVSTDETRLSLGGVFIESVEKNQVRMVATDGHRLALVEREIVGVDLRPGVILPRKGLVEAKRLLEDATGDVTFSIAGNLARVERAGVELFMRLIEGEFPDYRQVIPKESKRRARVDRELLFGALRRVSILSSERSRGVKLRLQPGMLEVVTTNPDTARQWKRSRSTTPARNSRSVSTPVPPRRARNRGRDRRRRDRSHRRGEPRNHPRRRRRRLLLRRHADALVTCEVTSGFALPQRLVLIHCEVAKG